jgi:hypothetical protein
VSFRHSAEGLMISCEDRHPRGIGSFKTVLTNRASVLKELTGLARDFFRVAEDSCPSLANHPWFVDWAGSLRVIVKHVESSSAV